MLRIFILSLFLLFQFNFTCVSQATKVTLGINIIPRVKVFPVDGHLDISDSILRFTPSNHQIIKPLSFPFDKIHRIYTNGGPLRNRIFLETDSSSYTFYTYRASKVVKELKMPTSNMDKRHWEAFLMKRIFPFVLPIVNDFHWRGVLSLTDNDVIFKPQNQDLVTISVKFDKVLKVKTKGYWMFYPRNIIEIKTVEKKYKLVVQEPKAIKDKIYSLIDEKL
jgi:hypothetical protein